MKFKKLGGLDNFDDKRISLHGEMPITMADAFVTSEKTVDEINKKLDERQKEIDKFVKETEDKKNYKLTLPEENRANYKKMGLIENLSKMSREELMEALDKCASCKEEKELKEEKNKKPLWKKRGWDLFERVYANLIRTSEPSEKNNEVPDTKRGCRYEYDELGYDRDGSIILENEDEEYFDFAKKVVDYFSKFGVKMEGPKPSLKNDKILIARIIIPEEEIRDTVKYEDD